MNRYTVVVSQTAKKELHSPPARVLNYIVATGWAIKILVVHLSTPNNYVRV